MTRNAAAGAAAAYAPSSAAAKYETTSGSGGQALEMKVRMGRSCHTSSVLPFVRSLSLFSTDAACVCVFVLVSLLFVWFVFSALHLNHFLAHLPASFFLSLTQPKSSAAVPTAAAASTATAAESTELPGGWTKILDNSSGAYYYFNKNTQETRWEAPV